jgi:UDP-N-acetylmuramoyl-tripeptide--D-alanyl-D-alanine ligase
VSALWTSEEIAAATSGQRVGPPFSVGGVAIDSREAEPGDLFVALSGERDGADFIPAALARGAAGSLTHRAVEGSAVLVPDTLAALEALGEAARRRAAKARRGAVTGSVGKTSVTQAVLAGLHLAGPAHGSVRSFNNHIGVPLTLARMPAATERAVFEIGMNHAGEITPLSGFVRPHAAAITTVEKAHVENFADGEAGVAAAKAEIFAGVAPGGIAILNADNRWFDFLRGRARQQGLKVRTFGAAAGADARLERFARAPGGASVAASIDGRRVEYPLLQSADHWGPMSLCVLLMLQALDVDLDTGMAGLSAFAPLEGRGAERNLRGLKGPFLLIDESYNASPAAVSGVVAALGARRSVKGRRMLALTDMLELGAESPDLHAGLAGSIEAARIDLVFCAGPLTRYLYDALPESRRGAWRPTAKELVPEILAALGPDDAILVKGSKASKASLIVEALSKEHAA